MPLLYEEDQVKLYHGHVLAELRQLPDASVHCVCTSPPYWGLRDYQLEPQIWDDPGGCAHVWGDTIPGDNRGGSGTFNGRNGAGEGYGGDATRGQWCQVNGCWCGSLGLEPTPQDYVRHLVQVFEEVKRVLHPSGTLWIVIADSYSGAGSNNQGRGSSSLNNGKAHYPCRVAVHGTGGYQSNGISLKPKDLCMIPARVALALQDAGWWVRSEIIWAKKACIPESVTDRPTSATEKIFLFAKSSKYFYDNIAIRNPIVPESLNRWHREEAKGLVNDRPHKYEGNVTVGRGIRAQVGARTYLQNGANLRNFWLLGPESFRGAHYAAYPTEIPRRCISLGTSERGCCPTCLAPWGRVIDRYRTHNGERAEDLGAWRNTDPGSPIGAQGDGHWRYASVSTTLGWRPTCRCHTPREGLPMYEPIPCTVLDPFAGSGTSLFVARDLGRHSIGIELNPDYGQLAIKRLRQQVLPLTLGPLTLSHAEALQLVEAIQEKQGELQQQGHPDATKDDALDALLNLGGADA